MVCINSRILHVRHPHPHIRIIPWLAGVTDTLSKCPEQNTERNSWTK